MKKYVKPMLIYESFEMSQQIATCEYDSNNTNNDVVTCTFTGPYTGDAKLFLDSNSACAVPAEGYCEHASTGNLYNLFNS